MTMVSDSQEPSFVVIDNPTEDELSVVSDGYEEYNMEQTNGEYNSPEEWLSLVLKDHDGNIVGGIMTSTVYWAQYLEVLWVDEKYRGQGYGKDLILEAERLAKKNGCVSSNTYTFSWQAPDFYQAVGYHIAAIYDGYVGGIKEYILSKDLSDTKINQPSVTEPKRFRIVKDSSKEAKSIVRKGLGSNFEKHVSAVLKEYPHLSVGLVGKNSAGAVVGGMTGYTVLGTLNIDEFWVQRKYRNQGLGTRLLEAAERLARERKCLALQTYCHTFQNLDFMHNRGFSDYGQCDGYQQGTEYYLIKRLK